MLSIGSNINEARVDGSLQALLGDLQAFREFGLTAAEISCHGLDAVRNGRLDRRRTADVRSILEDFPFRISVHAPNPLNLMDTMHPGLHRDVLFAALEFTEEIGGEVLVYHPGRYLAEEEFAVKERCRFPPAERERLLDAEAGILAEAADRFPGISIGMENARPYLHHSPYCYAELPGGLVAQVERVGRGNVGITLDVGHLQMSASQYGLDPVEEAGKIAPHVVHCHVHDNFGRAAYHTEKLQTHQIPFGKGDSHMPVGWGTVPIRALLAAFIDGYDGLLICELRSRYFPQTGESARALEEILEGLGILFRRPAGGLSPRS